MSVKRSAFENSYLHSTPTELPNEKTRLQLALGWYQE